MQVHTSFDTTRDIKKPVVTTGTFDGVHIGHQVIIRRLNKLAADINGESVLITFHPHPRRVLYPDTAGKDLKLICSQQEKKSLLEETGLDHLIILEFTKEFARVTSRGFIEDYLVAKLHARVVVVGFNHHFGYNREGNFSYLYQLGRQHGFEVEEIPEQDIHNESVSSTKIRTALWEGNIQRANAYLDHYYFIMGSALPVLLSTEDFGHAKFTLSVKEDVKLIPAIGTYAVNIKYLGVVSKGLLNIVSCTILGKSIVPENKIEFYFLDSTPSFTGGEVAVYFHKQIRNGAVGGNGLQAKALLQKDLRAIEELIF